MASKTTFEMRWIDAWNDLLELAGDDMEMPCQLPNGRIVNVEDCKGWLQTEAYDAWCIEVTRGKILGKSGVIAARWPEAEMTRDELIMLVQRIRTVPEAAEELIDVLIRNVPHPNPADLIFHPRMRDHEQTDANIVDEALSYKPIEL